MIRILLFLLVNLMENNFYSLIFSSHIVGAFTFMGFRSSRNSPVSFMV